MSIIKKILFKIKLEYLYPRLIFSRIIKKIFGSNNFKNTNFDDSLCLIYNLSTHPITFDFIEIICQAELQRKQKYLKFIDIIFIYYSKDKKFVLKPNYGEYSKFVNDKNYKDRFYEILIQSTKLFNSVKNIHLIDERSYKYYNKKYNHTYPLNFSQNKINNFTYTSPNKNKDFYPMIESSKNDLNFINRYLKNKKIKKKIITISIRDYPFIKLRNSNIKAWVEFAKKYRNKYEFIFISDNSNFKVYDLIERNKFITFDFIAWSIPLRAALYKHSFLNMSVGSGPIHLSLFQDNCMTLMFIKNYKKLLKSGYLQSINDYYNLEVGKNRKFLNKYNKYIWKNDTFYNIDSEFQKLLKELSKK